MPGVSVTVYLNTKHCRLEQCDDGATFSTKSWKNYRERVGLSFHWDTCDIEGMVEEKMVNSSFGGVSDT